MIHYTPLIEEDIEQVLYMMSQFYEIDDYPFNKNRTENLLKDFANTPSLGEIWIIKDQQNTVGYAIITYIFSFEYGGKIAFLDELYIKKEYQGKGIGKQTVSFLKEKALHNHCKIMYLEVEEHNIPAQKLYLANGFNIHKRKLLITKFE